MIKGGSKEKIARRIGDLPPAEMNINANVSIDNKDSNPLTEELSSMTTRYHHVSILISTFFCLFIYQQILLSYDLLILLNYSQNVSINIYTQLELK